MGYQTQVGKRLFVCMLMGALLRAGETSPELKPAATLNQSTESAAQGAMTATLLHRSETGWPIIKIRELRYQSLRPSTCYNTATEENSST